MHHYIVVVKQQQQQKTPFTEAVSSQGKHIGGGEKTISESFYYFCVQYAFEAM